ncbi:MAG: protein of unknown function with transrane region [Parcubacteria group bacterium]|nr:protein of unknown function with transrane region [Parcubacteria group bacterium]
MDPTIASSVPATTGPVHFLNIEYVFYLLYQLVAGGQGGGAAPNLNGLVSVVTALWVVVTVLAYIVSLGFLALLVYSTIRMHQIKDEDAMRFTTVSDSHHAEQVTEHHRWNHVRELIESSQENDWRQAIVEADIILDDMLTRLGYPGASVGEKLRAVDPAKFHTLQEAWDAHKVRNELAHQGSAYPFTDHIAYRTILQYENVFREHGEI